MSATTDRSGCYGRNRMDVVGPKRTYTRHRYNPDDPELFYPPSPSTKFVNVMVRCVRSAFHDKTRLPMLKHLSGPGRETVFSYLGCLVYYWKLLTPVIAPKMGNTHDLWTRARFAGKAGISYSRAKLAEKELEISVLLGLQRQGGQKPAIRGLMAQLVREFSDVLLKELPDFPKATTNEKKIIAWIKAMLGPEGEARAMGQERSRFGEEKKGPMSPEEAARSFAIGNRFLDELFKKMRMVRKPWATGPPATGALPSPT